METSLIDVIPRFSAFGILLLSAALFARDARQNWTGRFAAALSISVAVYMLCSFAPAREASGALLPALQLVCLSAPPLLWLTALSFFRDGFRPRWPHWVVLLVVETTGMLSLAGHLATVFAVVHGILTIALFVHAMIVAQQDLAADLVESRRRFRHLFVVAVALLGIGIALVELSAPGAQLPGTLETLAAWGVMAVVAGLAWPLLRIESSKLLPAAVIPAVTTVEPDRSPDQALLERVRASMTEGRLYRQTGLSIRDLADELRVPEHRLRRAINQGLGERNFNTFVNRYRLTEVCEALSDPGQARLPILTIALESGFGSLAPFNRAFREQYGVTPSEYRERALRQQECPTNLLDSGKT